MKNRTLTNNRDVALLRLYTAIHLLFVASCAPQSTSFHSLLNSQPYVVSLSPKPYEVINSTEGIQIIFSNALDPSTVNDKGIYVSNTEVDPKNAKKEEIPKVEGTLQSSADSTSVTWHPQADLPAGQYTLVVTPDLQADNHASFNQSPGQSPEPFIATFYAAGSDSNSNSSDSPLPTTGSPSLPLHRPTSLVLNEILYDAAGSDTDGNEFIELYGTPGADIDGYQIALVNGSNGEIQKTITLPAGSKVHDNGIFLIADANTNDPHHSHIPNPDFIDNFDPQNGPDALQLLNDQGHLIDTVCYGEGSVPIAHNGYETCEGAPAPDVPSGHSISRVNGADSNQNHTDFIDLASPTPGEL